MSRYSRLQPNKHSVISVISTIGGVIAIQLLRKGLGYIGSDTETVNLVIGLILISVLYLDRQLNRKGKEELRL